MVERGEKNSPEYGEWQAINYLYVKHWCDGAEDLTVYCED